MREAFANVGITGHDDEATIQRLVDLLAAVDVQRDRAADLIGGIHSFCRETQTSTQNWGLWQFSPRDFVVDMHV